MRQLLNVVHCSLVLLSAIAVQLPVDCEARSKQLYIFDHNGHLACAQTGESVEVDCLPAGNENDVVFQTDASRSRVVFSYGRCGFELLRHPLQVRPLFNGSRIASLGIGPDGTIVAISSWEHHRAHLLIDRQASIEEHKAIDLPVSDSYEAQRRYQILDVSHEARYLCMTSGKVCQIDKPLEREEIAEHLVVFSLQGDSAPWFLEGRRAWFVTGDTMLVWSSKGVAKLISVTDRQTTEIGIFRLPVVSADRRHVLDCETGARYNLVEQSWSQSACKQIGDAGAAWVSRLEFIDARHVVIWRSRLVMIPVEMTLLSEHVIELCDADSGARQSLYRIRVGDEQAGFLARLLGKPRRLSPLGYYLELSIP